MILISEVAHPGEVHLEVNCALLKIFGYLEPGEHIIYRAEEEQINIISTYAELPKNIDFVSFNKYYDPKAFSWFARITGEIKEIYSSIRLGKKLNAQTYVWTCIFSTGHFFLSLYLFFFNNKNVKHLVVLHGELEFLKKKNRKWSEVFLGTALKLAINFSRKNTQYIVLGDCIKMQLKKYFPPGIIKRIVAILHPYNYNITDKPLQFNSKTKPIVFGAIGTQMLKKNSNSIFELAYGLENEVVSNNISFVTIGKVLPEIVPFANVLVSHRHSTSFVPQSMFESEAKKLEFVLFFYNNDSYQLCASGAIFEAIKLGLPVISIHNDYFSWLFDEYGKMGFLCNNLDEIKDLILQIVEGRLDVEINDMLKTIEEFRIRNNIESIATDLAGKLR